MIKSLWIIYSVLIVFIGISYTSLSQPRNQQRLDRSSYFEYNETFFCEAHALPSLSKDSTIISILFRIMYDPLEFHQLPTSAMMQRGVYLATPFVMVELRDDIGIIRFRNQWKDSIFTKTFEQTNSKTDFIYGTIKVTLPIGAYSLSAVLSDRENSQLRRVQFPSIKSPTPDSGGISKPIFVEYVDTTSRVVIPMFASGNALFSQNNIHALITVAGVKDGDVYSYSYAPVVNSNSDVSSEWGNLPSVSGNTTPIRNTILVPTERNQKEFPGKQTYSLSTIPKESSLGSFGLLDITLPASTIAPGKYKIRVVKVGTKDTSVQPFDVIWENMPLSFRSMRYMIEALYYILNDDDFDAINSGSDSEKRRKVIEYWQKNYPSSESIYNHTMAEYYRRVDYAYFNFQVIGEQDGAKSERGKIYILYGAPTTIEKNTPSSGQTQEIWHYANKVKKDFVFELNTSSIYKLKDIVDLTAK
ncbi:MAG: GWxTD domain-containing protein [Ignavibacteriae bacterium]|nr:GWxTD domain-containing protein [Ignavibacteriota bacterium]